VSLCNIRYGDSTKKPTGMAISSKNSEQYCEGIHLVLKITPELR